VRKLSTVTQLCATHCNALHRNTLQHTATHIYHVCSVKYIYRVCSVLQCVAVRRMRKCTLDCPSRSNTHVYTHASFRTCTHETSSRCSLLQNRGDMIATHCNTLQHTATHSPRRALPHALQHTATNCTNDICVLQSVAVCCSAVCCSVLHIHMCPPARAHTM